MIIFIEFDTQGNIAHIKRDVDATIVPLINTVEVKVNGVVSKDASGNNLSPFGYPMHLPEALDEQDFETLMATGVDKSTFDATTGKIAAKGAISG